MREQVVERVAKEPSSDAFDPLHVAGVRLFCDPACAARSIPSAGRRNPFTTSIWSSFSAGWPTHMSRVLPKSGGALCDVQGYERPASGRAMPLAQKEA